ncbi:hypothetical protein [Streptomyces glycanivorans]|uniref:DUF304 domain-containing protein n=1 Tax=Streptomyces glycanivorans TaxID=3033808 RepID=A0ABY9JNH6_9ACTN|nr:hypothetical protein [Streptomyces sp. Alt3]WLQ67636.1 hypothetical protein P8A20_30510 [Streptomyces sp. Alt3]
MPLPYLPGEVWKQFQLRRIAYRRIRNVTDAQFQPRNHTHALTLKVDTDMVELSYGFVRGIRKIGCLGTGPLEVRIRSQEDLARATSLAQRSIEGL